MQFEELKKFLVDNKATKIVTKSIQDAFNINKQRSKSFSMDSFLSAYGVYTITIKNAGRQYRFENLKPSYSKDENITGLSLNHYGWVNLPMPTQKKSQFHDNEDVCIDIKKENFISAVHNNNAIQIKMKTWTATITWH